ncbi:MAG: response regulator [Candidatus Moranbacteria bacterium]|jgi:DNA-binding response OmpR family regulator|nr:response regulator [Candidatus Moranbacteria bacterium]
MAEEKKKKLLVVEDDEFISAIYAKKLSMEGYEVRLAGNGERALSMMNEEKPDLVLLDIIMPIMDGLETLQRIRADEKLRDVKVAVLSNLSEDKDMSRTRELGAIDYLVKANISVADLSTKVAGYLAA